MKPKLKTVDLIIIIIGILFYFAWFFLTPIGNEIKTTKYDPTVAFIAVLICHPISYICFGYSFLLLAPEIRGFTKEFKLWLRIAMIVIAIITLGTYLAIFNYYYNVRFLYWTSSIIDFIFNTRFLRYHILMKGDTHYTILLGVSISLLVHSKTKRKTSTSVISDNP